MQKLFDTNVIGPAYVTQVFLPLVEKSKKKTVVNVSSELGRLTADFGTLSTSYSITKAALNMLVSPPDSIEYRIVRLTTFPLDVQAAEGASRHRFHLPLPWLAQNGYLFRVIINSPSPNAHVLFSQTWEARTLPTMWMWELQVSSRRSRGLLRRTPGSSSTTRGRASLGSLLRVWFDLWPSLCTKETVCKFVM